MAPNNATPPVETPWERFDDAYNDVFGMLDAIEYLSSRAHPESAAELPDGRALAHTRNLASVAKKLMASRLWPCLSELKE